MLFKIEDIDDQDFDGKQLSMICDNQPVRSDIALDEDCIEEKC